MKRLAKIYPRKVNKKSLHLKERIEKTNSNAVAICNVYILHTQILASNAIQQDITKTKQMRKIIACDNSIVCVYSDFGMDVRRKTMDRDR